MTKTWKPSGANYDRGVVLPDGRGDWIAGLQCSTSVDPQELADLLNREQFMIDPAPPEPVKRYRVIGNDKADPNSVLGTLDQARQWRDKRELVNPYLLHNIEEVLVPAEPELPFRTETDPGNGTWTVSANTMPKPKPKYRVRCSWGNGYSWDVGSKEQAEREVAEWQKYQHHCTHTVEQVRA